MEIQSQMNMDGVWHAGLRCLVALLSAANSTKH